jgi:hypothetical protein
VKEVKAVGGKEGGLGVCVSRLNILPTSFFDSLTHNTHTHAQVRSTPGSGHKILVRFG